MKEVATKSKRIYLDYASSTPIDDQVFSSYINYLKDFNANPHSLHKEGVNAHNLLLKSRERVARSLGALPREIFFVGSATESDNLAIRGTVISARKDPVFNSYSKLHVVISSIEHAAVIETVTALEKDGLIEVDYIPVSQDGVVLVKEFKKLLRTNTVLVSVMQVNNEIGSIQPIGEIAKIIRHARKNKRTTGLYPYLHTDASQSLNFLDVNVEKLGVDLLTCSSSKVYGPKGVGILYKKRTISLDPIIFGGGQEQGFRSGTENVPTIAACSLAIEKASAMVSDEIARVTLLRNFLYEELKNHIPKILFHGSMLGSIPGILSFTIPGIESDLLVLYLDAQGFAVSSKSACHTDTDEISHVLMAVYGEESRNIGGTIRVSIGRYTEKDDLEKFVLKLVNIFNLIVKN